MQKKSQRPFPKAVRHALEGCRRLLRTERNARVHAAFTVAVMGMCAWLRLPLRDWAVIVLTIALVWAAEAFNTALEALTDLIHPEQHELAKIAKDVSAAGVLIVAAASVLVGLLVIGPPLWGKVAHLFVNP
jgi:diacylglycerol kinase